MDYRAAAFHPAEPRHLPLRELVDGVGQQRPHLVERQNPEDILSHELILQSVIHEIGWSYSVVYQPLDFFDHAFGEPFVQPAVNPGYTLFAGNVSPYEISILRQEAGAADRMLALIESDLQRPYDPALGFHDRRVSDRT